MPSDSDSDSDRELFERAVAELERMSERELSTVKSEPSSSPPTVARPPRLQRRVRDERFRPHATIDLHGLTRSEAIAALRRFLDSHSAAEPRIVLIVHGKGTGILAQAIGSELDRHPWVGEHAAAPQRFGGSGARLARIRRKR